MMFNFNKTIEVHCYTSKKFRADHFNVKEMFTHKPEWYKRLSNKPQKKTVFGNKCKLPAQSIKNCYGIINLFKQSFYFPLWTDLTLINTIEDINVIANKSTVIGGNHLEGTDSKAPTLSTHHRHLQIKSPWIFKCDKDINFHVAGASWDYINNNFYDFNLPPAIIDFKYQHYLHLQFLFPIPTGNQREAQIDLKAGDPIIYITPLTERKVKFITHSITKNEFSQMTEDLDGISPFRHNSYFRSKTLMKE